MDSITVQARDARGLLAPADLAEVRATLLCANPTMDEFTASRILREALAFVAACATSSTQGLRPSRVVDEGWHALILHTRIYANLCARLGRFVHHAPEAPDPTRHSPGALDDTQAAIRAAGYTVDPLLWAAPLDTTIPVAASCQHGPPGPEGSCTGSGEGDGPSGPN